jgi:hypothetical protein
MLLISTVAIGSFAAYALQPMSIPLEVKEPLEILDYPSGFSLYPGETVTFDITVRNLASVTYCVELDFHLNDTEYQSKYVTFSNTNYSIPPGTQKLSAWLTIALTAPPASLMITVSRKTDTPSASPTPSPKPSTTSLVASQELLGGGARWASRNGTSALYVNWKDCYDAHHLTDGANWGWFSEIDMENWRSSVANVLQQSGFEVTLAGDIPDNLDDYDLVVLNAGYAVEPRHEELIRDYIFNGGGVILMSSMPCYLTVYSKTESMSVDVSSIQDWFGGIGYLNVGGIVTCAFNNPFGTSLLVNDVVLYGGTYAHAGFSSLSADATAIAFWNSNVVFAFTHTYGYGRVYYQSTIKID